LSVPRLTLAPLGFLELDPPTLVATAAKAGFASVALRLAPAVPGGIHYPLRPGSRALRETLARVGETGVHVLQVELVVLTRDTDVPALRPLLEAASELGATRLGANGDDDDAFVAERLAELADLAAEHGLSVDVEFMPFRRLATLPQAVAIVAEVGRDDVAVMVDALHLARSDGTPADVATVDPERLCVLQLCDAAARAPAPERLAHEAREERLLPGAGELPLQALVEAMPRDALLAVEAPTRDGSAMPATERARAAHAAAVAVLESG
jgi:sugar phosphate isomerase/epimerase